MSIISRMLSGREERSTDYSMKQAVQDFLSGNDDFPTETSAGPAVTISGSMQLTAVYSCVRLISWTIASLPFPVYRDVEGGGKVKAKDDPLYKLIHDKPNPYQTSFKWRELMATHLNLWGAGISEIEFNKKMQPVALWPIPPWKVTPKRTEQGSIYYEIDLDNGEKRKLLHSQVVVISALSTSSFEWCSPIALHRETIAAAVAVRDFGAKMFGQGTNPAGIVTYPGKISETSENTLNKKMKCYSGLGNSHRLMLLDQGMEFKRVGLPPEDAQYLETRGFDITEIARIFNVPLFMLQDQDKQTSWGTGIEEQKDGFVTFTITPYLVQWEMELKVKVFEGTKLFAEFRLEGLLRGKLADRVEAYKKLWEMGTISANEIREKENLNPIPGGDVYFVPMNMQKATDVGKEDKKDNDVDKEDNNDNDNDGAGVDDGDE